MITMKILALALLSFVILPACTTGPAVADDASSNPVTVALAKAKSENKMLFIMEGRKECGNCEALRQMIHKGELALPADKFVVAEVNVDDEKTDALFMKHFKVSGEVLPFVAVTAPNGKQLAAHAGGGSLDDFKKMVETAKKRMGQ